MKILVWGRGAGKTTKAIETLRKTPDACMFVINHATILNQIPKDVKDRVFSYRSYSWIGTKFTKAIIDEADFMEDKKLQELEKYFEIILVVTSIGKSYDNSNTWLRKKIAKFGFNHKSSGPISYSFRSSLSQEQFEKEFLAKFKEVVEKPFNPSER